VRKGKRSAHSVPPSSRTDPWVQTRNSTADDVSTLAHELGHAVTGCWLRVIRR